MKTDDKAFMQTGIIRSLNSETNIGTINNPRTQTLIYFDINKVSQVGIGSEVLFGDLTTETEAKTGNKHLWAQTVKEKV